MLSLTQEFTSPTVRLSHGLLYSQENCLPNPSKLTQRVSTNIVLSLEFFKLTTSLGIQTVSGGKTVRRGFPTGPVVKNLPCNAGDIGLNPGPGISRLPQSDSAQLLSLRSGVLEPQVLKPMPQSPSSTTREATARKENLCAVTKVQPSQKQRNEFKKYTCTPMVDSCQCMAKPLQYCKVINLQLK